MHLYSIGTYIGHQPMTANELKIESKFSLVFFSFLLLCSSEYK